MWGLPLMKFRAEVVQFHLQAGRNELNSEEASVQKEPKQCVASCHQCLGVGLLQQTQLFQVPPIGVFQTSCVLHENLDVVLQLEVCAKP